MQPDELSSSDLLRKLRDELTRFMMAYKFGLDEVLTKINILQDEFNYIHEYNPIEHVKSRLKSADSILDKVRRKGGALNLDEIKERVLDIAGVRISCSFVADIYTVRDMLIGQEDLVLREERDYIANPKPNGYQSLHLIVQVPVYLSDRVEKVTVEIQIRTIAMDFWASLEHKIYYKYNKEVPEGLVAELKQAAVSATALDQQMERLHREVLLHEPSHQADGENAIELYEPNEELIPNSLFGSQDLLRALAQSVQARVTL